MFREIHEIKNNETRKKEELGYTKIKSNKEFSDEEIMLFWQQEIAKAANKMALN